MTNTKLYIQAILGTHKAKIMSQLKQKTTHCIYCDCPLTKKQIASGYDKCDRCTDKLESGADMYP